MTEAHDQAKGLIERADGCLAVLDHLRQSTTALANISPGADISLFIAELRRSENGWHDQLQMLRALLTELTAQTHSARGEIKSLAALALGTQTTSETIVDAEHAVEASEAHFQEVIAQLEATQVWFEHFDTQINTIMASLRKSR
ncbi:hypothetical protein LMG24238_02388 [Paraburkholderia sediminicola]|uniref:Uncharacterized protein n=1 Tax=Paraburkholderia sediminicola TaxID=458836 RepID=A0A6J5AP57_9BURK|nr:hypothetical protein [Paraburkholderia sediminicola]CAB3676519.1 hypothetical protein LMG24238_02388 [Paraburkholderia sediminicola]